MDRLHIILGSADKTLDRQPSRAPQAPQSPTLNKTDPAIDGQREKEGDNPPDADETLRPQPNLTGMVQVKINREVKQEDIVRQELPPKCNASLHLDEHAELHPELHAMYVDHSVRSNKDTLQHAWTPPLSTCSSNQCYQPSHHRDGVLSPQCLAAAGECCPEQTFTCEP